MENRMAIMINARGSECDFCARHVYTLYIFASRDADDVVQLPDRTVDSIALALSPAGTLAIIPSTLRLLTASFNVLYTD